MPKRVPFAQLQPSCLCKSVTQPSIFVTLSMENLNFGRPRGTIHTETWPALNTTQYEVLEVDDAASS